MSAKPTFFARRALIILVVVFFLVPFALRGARMAIQGMKNDVKDWLPKDFPETAELEWFRDHFVSEQFVIASWEGCYGGKDDNKYNLFLAKLEPETPPSQRAKPAKSADGRRVRERRRQRRRRADRKSNPLFQPRWVHRR
jgi:hypothetical protein